MRTLLAPLFFALGLLATTATRADDKADAAADLKKFQGTWTTESSESGGNKVPADMLKGLTVTFTGDKFSVKFGNNVALAGSMKLDPTKKPKAFDVTSTEGMHKGTTMLGIYEIDGDTLKVCMDPEGKIRPTEFKTAAGSEVFFNVHKRVKK